MFLHFFFFFNDTATTEIYTLSLHDALPISPRLAIIGGGGAALSSPAELLEAGCSQICATRGEARRVMRRLALQRARSRSLGIIPSFPGLNPQANVQEP